MKLADLELLEHLAAAEARESFWAFRQYMNPHMKKGWWQRDVARVLQQFIEELVAGKRPKYVLEAPPQHGKSYQIIDLIAWVSGKYPHLRNIFASFSDRLGIRANLRLQRIMDSEKFQKVFPYFKLKPRGDLSIVATRTTELLEYLRPDWSATEGSFRNTTVNGAITGEGLDVGYIDDPLKGRKEAGSETVRNATWDWFTDDFFTRFSEDAGFIFILTRWHVDDPVGRLLSEMPDGVKVFKYPALAIDGAKLMPTDPRAPGSGEALFPEHKSAEFILERKRLQAAANFESLYQQNPQILGGEIIKGQWFQRYKLPPKILWRCIFADTAQKIKEANDYSVFECWGKGEDGKIYLLDLIRGKWEAPELRKRAKDFWAKHLADVAKGALRAMKVEDKSSGTGLIQDLKINERIPVVPIPRGGPGSDKLTRVMGVVSYIESGYVCVPEDAPWVSDFIDECEAFTADDTHAFDDQIDPMCDAIEDLLAAKPRGIVDVLSQKKG